MLSKPLKEGDYEYFDEMISKKKEGSIRKEYMQMNRNSSFSCGESKLSFPKGGNPIIEGINEEEYFELSQYICPLDDDRSPSNFTATPVSGMSPFEN